jgi:hypothetical protein
VRRKQTINSNNLFRTAHLVGFGLALISHVAKLLGNFWFARRRFPQFGRCLPQKDDRLAEGIDQLSHARLPTRQCFAP